MVRRCGNPERARRAQWGEIADMSSGLGGYVASLFWIAYGPWLLYQFVRTWRDARALTRLATAEVSGSPQPTRWRPSASDAWASSAIRRIPRAMLPLWAFGLSPDFCRSGWLYAAFAGGSDYSGSWLLWLLQRVGWHGFGMSSLVLLGLAHDARVSLRDGLTRGPASAGRAGFVGSTAGAFLFVGTCFTHPKDAVSLVTVGLAHFVSLWLVAAGFAVSRVARERAAMAGPVQVAPRNARRSE
jgi:hypothetical protein